MNSGVFGDHIFDQKYKNQNVPLNTWTCGATPPHSNVISECAFVLYVREMFPDNTKSCVLFEFINISRIFGILTYKFK